MSQQTPPEFGLPVDPEYTYVSFKSFGNIVPGPKLSQKIGSFGVNAKQLGADLAKLTQEYDCIRVNSRFAIKNRQATIEVTPGTSSLIIKALREPKRDIKKEKNVLHTGDISMIDVVEIAKLIRFKSLSKKFEGTVRQVVGCCKSIGCTIDGMSPKEVIEKMKSGAITVPEI
ncbi:60S ribosomal protein L12 [Cucumispora dikerogammari]|nr:60S ribosomal protein L12 [Cucumispora dikerogammari]